MSPITCAVGGSRYKPCEGEESHTCVTVFADKAAYERVYRSMTFIPKKNNNKWNETVGQYLRKLQCKAGNVFPILSTFSEVRTRTAYIHFVEYT
jgi:hypothetical protein